MTEYSRRQLFDLVWAKPMTTVSSEIGLSDRGLAKICSRHKIPVPPRGYWAKVHAGAPATQPPFLELRDKSLDTISIKATQIDVSAEAKIRCARNKEVSQKALESAPPQEPGFIDQTVHIHKAVRATAKFLGTKKPDQDGAIRTTKTNQFAVVVSPGTKERAIGCLNQLAIAVDSLELQFEETAKGIAVSRGADSFIFNLRERTKRVPYTPTQTEIERKKRVRKDVERRWKSLEWGEPSESLYSRWPKFVYEWTGDLVLTVDVWANGTRKTWSDGKRQRLESMIPDVSSGFVLILDVLATRREERAREEIARAQMAERQRLARARRDREEKRRAALSEIISLRKEAMEIREWIQSLPADHGGEASAEFQRMMIWARDRLVDLKARSGYEAAQKFAVTEGLFPETDPLHDPLGEPPRHYY